MGDDIKVRVLYKALQILDCFSVEKPELGITEISNKLGLYKSNVYNIISTFEHAGYLEKNSENNKYRLGLRVLGLANVINANLSLRKIVLPYMQDIANQSNETVYLAIPHDDQVLYLESSHPQNALPVRSMLGVTAPMYCTAIGKAILAHYPEDRMERVLGKGLKRFTGNTITDRNDLLIELAEVRRRGYSVDNMEHEHGVKCVAVPLINIAGQALAAISISGPSLRFSADRIAQYATILLKQVSRIQDKVCNQHC